MKIGILNSLYRRGGAETISQNQAADFLRQGQEVFFIVTSGRENKETARDARTGAGQKICYLNSLFSNLNKFPYLIRLAWQILNLFNLHKYYQIKKILKAEKPELIITNNLMGLGYLTPCLIKRLGIRHEHYLHDIQLLHPSGLMFYGHEKIIDTFGAKIYQTLTRALFKNIPKVISPSKWLLDLYVSRDFFKKAEKIIKPSQVIKTEPGIIKTQPTNPGAKKFLYVGQIEKSKGIIFLIQAWLKAELKAELNIIGTGQALATCQKLVAASGATNIKFLGWVDIPATRIIMKTCAYLIVPSLVYENSPTVIYEALAHDLPVVASQIGGIPELIAASGRADNFLFTPGNESELISILKKVA